ncbi:hypothetical protein NE865_01033 [Phthorimaea operculella]|nr:hypothetical protein NE865_01033 [Phthorimaea operculella]
MALINGYAFALNKKDGNFWRCTRHGSCKAGFYIDNNWTITRCITVQWVKNSAGKPIAVVNGYTFNLNVAGGKYWRCSRTGGGGSCKANFSVDGNWTITRHNLVHDHQPSMYIIRNGYEFNDNTVQWVKNAAGRLIAVINGYSFNLNALGGRYWRCSRQGTCRANFSVDSNWTITRHNLVHDHQPAKYIIRNGMYIKIQK